MMPSSFDVLRWTLLGALGASLVSCGGETSGDDGDGGESAGGGRAGDGGDSGAGGAAGSGSSTGTGGLGQEVSNCTNPVEQDGGFASCDEGFVHRPGIGDCPDGTPRSEPVTDAATVPDAVCYADADCTGALEYCMLYQGPAVGTYCASGCLTDADCGAGFICQCGSPLGACVSATCATDDDCQEGLLCTPWTVDDGCGPHTTYACQTSGDQCRSVADCGAEEECRPNAGGARVCQPREYLCAVGRPFFVDGEQRLALPMRRADWLAAQSEPWQGEGEARRARTEEAQLDWASIAQSAGALSPALRALVSQHFAHAGRMEHASIAAFARFALELLALGAPVELVELTNAAQVDETRHARLCFRLAEVYGGAPIGPGPLDLSGSLLGSALEGIVAGALVEGCIGETLAALEARESARRATCPALARLLTSIAEDEERHAELAYRFVRWALEREPRLTVLLGPAIEQALTDVTVGVAQGDRMLDDSAQYGGPRSHIAAASDVLEGAGVLSADHASLVRLRALREVVGPAFAALRDIGAAAAAPGRGEARQLL